MSREKYLALIEERKPKFIVGFDEVGNGAIAGELCVGACALPVSFDGEFRDSKAYTEKARNKAYDIVLDVCQSRHTFMFSPLSIAALGHKKALDNLFFNALYYMYAIFGKDALYIVDGTTTFKDVKFEHTAMVKADTYVPAVSAASILAKCDRDQRMRQLELEEWQFHKHKGYPTPAHLDMLKSFGPVKGLHRTNVNTVQQALDDKGWYIKANG